MLQFTRKKFNSGSAPIKLNVSGASQRIPIVLDGGVYSLEIKAARFIELSDKVLLKLDLEEQESGALLDTRPGMIQALEPGLASLVDREQALLESLLTHAGLPTDDVSAETIVKLAGTRFTGRIADSISQKDGHRSNTLLELLPEAA